MINVHKYFDYIKSKKSLKHYILIFKHLVVSFLHKILWKLFYFIEENKEKKTRKENVKADDFLF